MSAHSYSVMVLGFLGSCAGKRANLTVVVSVSL
jgi:hypothetical protein